ncbi:ATP-binding protein [Amycolatopsis suaedae]|uniref:ATP-binding protein n=1 Tax=Amycolatopsis suaedae TaxID=2510978 RepID=A0A4Q7J1Q4_9PSEU|nr:ATP-binding protein [Amycolatopsis suaedae]RZQ60512.1 ATP-binding protein [Amycolatopsis suaedae]
MSPGGSGAEPLLDLALTADPAAAARARAAVEPVLRRLDATTETTEIVLLLVTELVSNAVLHGEPPLSLRLSSREGRVRIEMTDGSSRRPVVREQSPDRPHGRGMILVQALAGRWAVDQRPGGKTVWAELPLAAAPLQ